MTHIYEILSQGSYRHLLGELKELAHENGYSSAELVFDEGITARETELLRQEGISVPALTVIS